jgi:putative PIN family toxin of toxin-antitoxin system
MRLVADTNTIISGLLWQGAPRQVLDLAFSGQLDLFTSATLLTELEDVFHREKFLQRLQLVGADPHELILEYAALATIVRPVKLSTIIQDDPDDDAVLSYAVAANALSGRVGTCWQDRGAPGP